MPASSSSEAGLFCGREGSSRGGEGAGRGGERASGGAEGSEHTVVPGEVQGLGTLLLALEEVAKLGGGGGGGNNSPDLEEGRGWEQEARPSSSPDDSDTRSPHMASKCLACKQMEVVRN